MPLKNPLKRKLYRKEYNKKNKEKLSVKAKKYNTEHKEEISKNKKGYYIKNREKILKDRFNSRKENPEKFQEKDKKYYTKNKRKIIINKIRYDKERIKKDIQYKLTKSLRKRLYMAIKDNAKSGSAIRDLGCTIPELKKYLENQFTTGMTWENWTMKGWWIDHKVPLANFDLTDREQFLKAVHYTNLQPMWWRDNLKKSNKITC
jgi:hypothetical protein